jgi:ATP-binding cassette subfamily B protein
MLLGHVLQSALEWVRTAQAELIQDHITHLLHQKALALDMAFYESPDYYDQLEQARGEAANRSRSLLENGGSLIQNTITLAAMAAILTHYGVWIPLLLVISSLPALCVLLHFDRRYHQWWQRTTVDRRRSQYYDLMLTSHVPAAEVRLFGLGTYFRTGFQSLRARLRTERLKQIRDHSMARLVASAAGLLGAGIIMGWMLWRVFRGMATLGDIALFYQALSNGQNLMRSVLSSAGQIYNTTLFLGSLFTFLGLKPSVIDPPLPQRPPTIIERGITFRHVTFRYPNSQRPALTDFSLDIPAGKIVAIVGANGAGKSTLVKLLCRFYDPANGDIELDDLNIRDFSVKDLWRSITVVFQSPLFHHASANQSIAFGDLELCPTVADLESAARSAGAHEFIERLPQGYETELGKQFGNGVELSAGEWQRVALARAYFRQAPIMILDEPTSAMDSWSEADWFDRLRALTENKTVLLITHRFSIAMRADVIHVMHEGRIVESGRHDELLAGAGLYAQSWTAQTQAGTSNGDEAGLISALPRVEDHTILELEAKDVRDVNAA